MNSETMLAIINKTMTGIRITGGLSLLVLAINERR